MIQAKTMIKNTCHMPGIATQCQNSGGSAPAASPVKAKFETQSDVARFFAGDMTPQQRLRKYIASINATNEEGGGKHTVGCAAPCRDFKQLMCLSHFENIAVRILHASSREDLGNIAKDFQVQKNALNDIITMARAATKRLQFALKSLVTKQETTKTASLAQASERRAPVDRRAQATRNCPDVFELAAGGKTAVKVVSLAKGSVTKLEDAQLLKVPLLIQLDPEDESIRNLAAKAADGAEEFANSKDRSTTGRQQRRLNDEHVKTIDEFVVKLLGHAIVDESKLTPAMKDEVRPSFFAVGKGMETCSAEFNHGTTLRFVFKGTRNLVLVNLLDLITFMSNTGYSMESLKMSVVYKRETRMFKEYVERFTEAFGFQAIQHVTVGPNNALLLPAGWLFYERISNGHDLAGFKKRCFRKWSRIPCTRSARMFCRLGSRMPCCRQLSTI